MRVLQLVQRPQKRGAEIFAHDLNNQFRDQGLQVKTVYLYRVNQGPNLSLSSEDVCLNGNEHHICEAFPRLEPTLLRKVMAEIQDFEPTIVQVNGSRTVKYGAFSRRLAGPEATWKLIYRNIGMPSDWHRWKASAWLYRKLVLPQMDGVIGVSHVSLEDAQSLYRFTVPSTVILNGISPARLRTTITRDELRRNFLVEPQDHVLLFVGQLDEIKRPESFIQVVAECSRRMPNLKAWVVGGGPLEKRTMALAAKCGVADRVMFFGPREDVANFMQAADLLVMTSSTEGVPAVVLESSFLALPVIAPRVGGLTECIRHSETGLLVDPDSPSEMIQAITYLIQHPDLRAQIAHRAKEWVESHVIIERIAARYLEFYRLVLSDRSKRTNVSAGIDG